MSDRIAEKFAALKKAKRKGLITFIMGGDPNLAHCQRLLDTLPKAGADLIEIGMPFSDPMADGPAIQAAGLRALKSGTKVKGILSLVKNFRKKDAATPLILMGYYNPIYRYGVEKFCKDAATAGADGVILVDLPPEEEEEFTMHATPHGLHLIRLIAPTTDDARLIKLTQHAGGFLYCISVAGITGAKSADAKVLAGRLKVIRVRSALPLAVGFGIKTPAQAKESASFSDAVVVGSALVEKVKKPKEALAFVKSLRKALDKF
jgi:tryptophan synthase alpha chain